MSDQVKCNVLNTVKMYIGRGKVADICRMIEHWINRAQRAECERDELQRENFGQSYLIEQLRRQVETLTKSKDNALDYSHRYKKALDDLVDLKEKQYAKIDGLESQNAALREILQDVLSDCDLSAGMRAEIERRLTESGDNQKMSKARFNQITDWLANGCEGECREPKNRQRCSDCPANDRLAALGEGE